MFPLTILSFDTLTCDSFLKIMLYRTPTTIWRIGLVANVIYLPVDGGLVSQQNILTTWHRDHCSCNAAGTWVTLEWRQQWRGTSTKLQHHRRQVPARARGLQHPRDCMRRRQSRRYRTSLRFDFDSTAIRPRYDHSTTYITTVRLPGCGLLLGGLNK